MHMHNHIHSPHVLAQDVGLGVFNIVEWMVCICWTDEQEGDSTLRDDVEAVIADMKQKYESYDRRQLQGDQQMQDAVSGSTHQHVHE